ncbi:hypothetical protein GGR57DRAFT_459284 [Xylariaceae sp. FL1272]|nr:hypothetical protein GGR57DRAFT_459284 [Xylariaceae sp. FL1272]
MIYELAVIPEYHENLSFRLFGKLPETDKTVLLPPALARVNQQLHSEVPCVYYSNCHFGIDLNILRSAMYERALSHELLEIRDFFPALESRWRQGGERHKFRRMCELFKGYLSHAKSIDLYVHNWDVHDGVLPPGCPPNMVASLIKRRSPESTAEPFNVDFQMYPVDWHMCIAGRILCDALRCFSESGLTDRDRTKVRFDKYIN